MSAEQQELMAENAIAQVTRIVRLFKAEDLLQRAEEMEQVARLFKAKIEKAGAIAKIKNKTTGEIRDYVKVEGWQTLGQLLHNPVFAFVEWTKVYKGGYEARAIARTCGRPDCFTW